MCEPTTFSKKSERQLGHIKYKTPFYVNHSFLTKINLQYLITSAQEAGIKIDSVCLTFDKLAQKTARWILIKLKLKVGLYFKKENIKYLKWFQITILEASYFGRVTTFVKATNSRGHSGPRLSCLAIATVGRNIE